MGSRVTGNALRCSTCLSAGVARAVQSSRRTFANSSIRQKYGAVPAFSDVSSPDLHSILQALREMVIMPSHLSKTQKDLIYKTRFRKTLMLEGATARLSGENFPLTPIDVCKDIPNVRKSLFKAISLMETKSDWDNLPRLLEGLSQAGVKLERNFTRVVRLAGQSGRQDVILECARQANVNRFKLNDTELAQQVLWWFQMKAVESEFISQVTRKALSWSEMVFEIIGEHVKDGLRAGSQDPRSQPEVVGILLQLSAARASKHLGGKDVDGKVAAYAGKLLNTSMEFGSESLDPASKTLWLSKTVPVLHGMKLAVGVLDTDSKIAKDLQLKIPKLESDILRVHKALSDEASESDKRPVGLELYQKLLVESV